MLLSLGLAKVFFGGWGEMQKAGRPAVGRFGGVRRPSPNRGQETRAELQTEFLKTGIAVERDFTELSTIFVVWYDTGVPESLRNESGQSPYDELTRHAHA